jgi:hypothetical protein
MRDRGADIVPPDVRFAGKCPVVTRAPPWTKTETVTVFKYEGDADEEIT